MQLQPLPKTNNNDVVINKKFRSVMILASVSFLISLNRLLPNKVEIEVKDGGEKITMPQKLKLKFGRSVRPACGHSPAVVESQKNILILFCLTFNRS